MAADFYVATWLHKALTQPDLSEVDHTRPTDADVLAFARRGVSNEEMFRKL